MEIVRECLYVRLREGRNVFIIIRFVVLFFVNLELFGGFIFIKVREGKGREGFYVTLV